jgi:trehalose-phosphatase
MCAEPGGRDVDRIADLVLDRLAGDGHLLLLTDYDGTLAPIASEPEAARLPEAVHADLLALAGLPRVQFGVVSGRDLQDLRRLVAVPDAIYGGCYGLEIEGPGIRFVHPDAEAQVASLDAISRELALRAPTVPGMRVEPKRFGLAVHYRHVPADLMERVETETARAIQRNGSRLKIFHGLQVMEIQPQVGWTKGDCVLWIRDVVRRTSGDRLTVLYMGDDWTDEFAFDALAGEALTISVGSLVPASKAAHRVQDVAAVRELLATIAARASTEDAR